MALGNAGALGRVGSAAALVLLCCRTCLLERQPACCKGRPVSWSVPHLGKCTPGSRPASLPCSARIRRRGCAAHPGACAPVLDRMQGCRCCCSMHVSELSKALQQCCLPPPSLAAVPSCNLRPGAGDGAAGQGAARGLARLRLAGEHHPVWRGGTGARFSGACNCNKGGSA